MDSDDVKWKSVETTSREILYYTNKITGHQKWTNKNCYCSKPKDPLKPTSPCCFKKPPMNLKSARKGWTTDHSYARRQIRSSLTKNLYCLSDIVSEVKKSYLAKEHRKHLRRRNSITLDFRKKVTATEDPKSDVRVTKDSHGNDKITEKSKDDVTFDIELQNDVNVSKDLKNNLKTTNNNEFPKDLKNDVISTLDLKNGSSFTSEVTKNDVTAKDDPIPLSEEPKDLVVGNENTKNDFNAVVDFINNVTVANDSKLEDVTVTVDREHDVIAAKDSDLNNDVTIVKDINTDKENNLCEAKDSNEVLSNEPSTTNDDITEDMEIDVTTIDNDVAVVKGPIDVIVTTDMENDVVESKDSNNAISEEPSKMNEKVIKHKRGLKRKRGVSDSVNGYKGRLRVRRNIQITIRRKYRRRKPLKNAVALTESAQLHSNGTPNNPTKTEKKMDSNVSQTDCDLIEQSIIEIDRYTSAYSVKLNALSSDLGSKHLRSEGAESGASNASTGGIEKSTSEESHDKTSQFPVEVSQPRFVDEKFVQMNIQFENVAEVDKKGSRKSKMIGSLEKKYPDPRRKRQKVSHTTVAFAEPSSDRPVGTQMRRPRPSSSSSCKTVSSVTMNLSSYMSEAGNEAISQADESSSKTFFSPNFAKTIKSSPSSSKCNFLPNRNRTQRSLNEIVNSMDSSSKVEVPMTSTVSMMHWSRVLLKESKKGTQSRPDAQNNDLSGNGTSLNTKQIDGPSCTSYVGDDCPESESAVFGHIEDACSIASMPQTLSIEPIPLRVSQLSSGNKHNSKTPGSRKSEAVRKTKTTRETGTNTINPSQVSFQTPEQLSNVTEVPASYVDLSWRIVTSNDGHSSSLSNFFKLVPITIARGPSGTVDAREPMSFLGVPINGGPAVIAKILNTSGAQNCNEIFKVSRNPNIKTAGTYVKKSTLSFVWERDTVLVNSESLKAGNLSGKDVKPRPPIWIDICNRVSIVLPKPLRLPEAGNVIYLGDFSVKSNCVEFVVTHSVVVTSSPRPSLTVPSGTPVNSTSTVIQAIRCRAPGKAKKDVQAAKKVSVGRKPSKGNIKTFQKCVFCGTDLKCRKDVKIHRKLHASLHAGTKCSECKRRFHNGGRLSVHLDTHKCNWLHVCSICKKPYKTAKILTPVDLAKDYYKMCLPCRRKELKCKKCSERTVSFEDLEVHLKEKHGLYCPICKCSFFFKRDLAKHMHIQHGIIGVPPASSTTQS